MAIVATVAVTTVGVGTAPPAGASNTVPTISVPASIAAPRNGSVAVTGIAVAANGATSLQVSLTVGQGTLTLASTAGLTFAQGSGSSDPTVTFTGTVAAVNAAIATVTYTPGAGYLGADTLGAQVTDGSSLYLAATGHFYQYVSDPGISWTDARNAAAASSLYGLTGYLATVTSSTENDFIAAKLAGNGWLGASDSAQEADWRWVTGPEAGTQFWQGDDGSCGAGTPGTPGPVNGLYSNWAGGEPNNCPPAENYAHFYSSNGTWNDFPDSAGASIDGYVVEYGGMPGDSPTISTASSAISVNATVPAAPTGVAASRGDTAATVSWSAPDDGGSAITGYTVTASPGGATVTVGGATTSVAVPGLTNGTPYTFTVYATNAVGAGPASSASASVTPAGVPGAPVITSAVAGDTQVTLTWSVPAANADPITGYTVSVTPGGTTIAVGSAPASVTVTGLVNGTQYSFTVRATNGVGDGSSSAAALATPAGVPGAPRNVVARNGVESATVSWLAPLDTGGAVVTSYTVTAIPGGASVVVPAPATSVVVEGLTAGGRYRFTVHATTTAGNGPESVATSAVQPCANLDPTPVIARHAVAVDRGVAVVLPFPAGTTGRIVGYARTPDRAGAWVVSDAGRVFRRGRAGWYGDARQRRLAAPIVGIAPAPDGRGFLLVGADGGVFTFGSARFYGSLANRRLAAPAVSITPTATGRGYYVLTADGGVNAFGDARAQGSLAGRRLRAPALALLLRCGGGYWIVARDGGVFTFGGAPFRGSLGGGATNVVAGMASTPDQRGYWLIRTNGRLVGFGAG